MRIRLGVGTVLCSAALLALAACGGGTSSPTANAAVEGTGTLDGGGKEIVMFLPTSTAPYPASFLTAATAATKKYNYTLKVFQNDFDQTQQDQQVQQFIASGDKPAAIIWYPSNVQASVNSLRQLARVAPVFQSNQRVLPDAAPYVTAYAGVNDTLIGEATGQQALKARQEEEAAGHKFGSPQGNLVEFKMIAGFQAGIDRIQGFEDATKQQPFNLLTSEATTALMDAQDGFNHASAVLPKYKAQGIDFVYTTHLDMANGVIKALQQNGFTPGKDVTVLTGNCVGNLDNLKNGSVYSAVVQPPLLEGDLVVRTAVQYLATGRVTDQKVTLDASPTEPDLQMEPPAKETYMPAPVVTKESLDTLQLWGLSGSKLCQ